MLRRLRLERYIALVLVFSLLAVFAYPALAPADDPLEEYLAEQSRAINSQQKILKEIESGKVQKTAYEKEIASLDAQMVVLGQQISAARTAIGSLSVLIDEATAAIAEATEHLNERQAYLESRLRDIYINGDITMLDVFFSAASFDEFIVLFDMVERIMSQDKDVLEDIMAARTLIEEQKASLEKSKQEQEFMLTELEAKNKELTTLQTAKAKANNELNLTLAQLQSKYEEEEAASAAAEKMIKEILASRQKKAYYGGVFRWPLPPGQTNVTSEFGSRFHPILKRNANHAGIDIGAPNGTEIYAAAVGEIIFMGWNGGYGNCIIIDHGGSIATLYGHMSGYGGYTVGDTVTTNNVIGYVGSTGQSTGNHLHFEVRVEGKATDPNPYVNRVPGK